MVTNAAVADFDPARLADPEVVRNPYPFYDRLRARSPVFGYRDYPPGTVPGVDEPEASWVVLNFDHVAAVAWDDDSFSSRDSLQEASDAPSLMLVNHDKPEHTRLRKIAAKAFAPSALRQVAPKVDELVRQTIGEMIPNDGSPVDVMAGYCALLPSRVMGYLLGVPTERDHDIRRWATAFMLSAEMPAADRQACNVAVMEFFTAHVQSHRDGPTGPLLEALRDTVVDGERLDNDELIRFCVTLTVAGAETTSFALGNLLRAFADIPGLWQGYRADPASFEPLWQESLRFYGPPQRLFRVAKRDTQLGAAMIKRGDWVACFFGAANYDPAVFPDPYAFVADRPNANRHMSFGYGIHRCLGAGIARMEAEATARILGERFVTIAAAGPPEWQSVSLLNHGLHSSSLMFKTT